MYLPHLNRLPLIARVPCLLIGLCLLLLGASPVGASELPSLGENSMINIERETQLGRSVYERLLDAGLVETHPLLDRYINDLGYRLLAGIENRKRDYKFFIVRDDSINAFALPGGYVGINQGLIMLARTQHQLASVMAHEIAHVELRHGLDMMSKNSEVSSATLLAMVAGLLLGSVDSNVGSAVMFGGMAGGQQAMVNFTRENEYEADRVGIELMSQAQFDPDGMVEFFKIMADVSNDTGGIEYLRTHPVNNNRVAEAIGRVSKLPAGTDQVDDYLLFKDYLNYTSHDHLPDQGSDYLRALALVKQAKYKEADRRLAALYDLDPENIWYSIAYAENLEYLDHTEEAELVYRRLLDIFPGDYVLSMRLLRLFKQEGRYQSALSLARQLEISYPDRQQVYFELSEIYQSLDRPVMKLMAEAEFHRITGNTKQAIRLYDQVLKSEDADIATISKAREKRLALLGKQ